MDRAIIKDSIRYYGASAQTVVCMEECAELIQAVSKTVRQPEDDEAIVHLAEEMADVTICLAMLQEIYGIPDRMVNTWIESKQRRIVDRMKGQK